jgi:hypothetical protein
MVEDISPGLFREGVNKDRRNRQSERPPKTGFLIINILIYEVSGQK